MTWLSVREDTAYVTQVKWAQILDLILFLSCTAELTKTHRVETV